MEMFQAAIITASDKGSQGLREDVSGQVVREILEHNGYAVVHQVILPDDRQRLADEMRKLCDEAGVDLILTTGGAPGFSRAGYHAGSHAGCGGTGWCRAFRKPCG